MEDRVDVVVVGGGIVGCSVALEPAGRNRFREIFLLERGPYLGDGTSTRNSYVIHAGIYYPRGPRISSGSSLRRAVSIRP